MLCLPFGRHIGLFFYRIERSGIDVCQSIPRLVGGILSVVGTGTIAIIMLPAVTGHHVEVALDLLQILVIGEIEVEQRIALRAAVYGAGSQCGELIVIGLVVIINILAP